MKNTCNQTRLRLVLRWVSSNTCAASNSCKREDLGRFVLEHSIDFAVNILRGDKFRAVKNSFHKSACFDGYVVHIIDGECKTVLNSLK